MNERQEPDWARLEQLVENGTARLGWRTEEGRADLVTPSLRAGLSRSYLHGVLRKRNAPEYENVFKLAHVFGDKPEEWLAASGYDPVGPPPWATQLERAIYARIKEAGDTPQVRAEVRRILERVRTQVEESQTERRASDNGARSG